MNSKTPQVQVATFGKLSNHCRSSQAMAAAEEQRLKREPPPQQCCHDVTHELCIEFTSSSKPCTSRCSAFCQLVCVNSRITKTSLSPRTERRAVCRPLILWDLIGSCQLQLYNRFRKSKKRGTWYNHSEVGISHFAILSHPLCRRPSWHVIPIDHPTNLRRGTHPVPTCGLSAVASPQNLVKPDRRAGRLIRNTSNAFRSPRAPYYCPNDPAFSQRFHPSYNWSPPRSRHLPGAPHQTSGIADVCLPVISTVGIYSNLVAFC